MAPRTRLLQAAALLTGATATLAAWDCTLQLGSLRYDLNPIKDRHEWVIEAQTPPTVLKNRYAISLCEPLPDPSRKHPDDDCPHGTRLCMRAFSAREGYDDRLLSVVPVAGDIGEGASGSGSGLAPRAEDKEGDRPEDKWVFEMGGGRYNGVDQKARIEMQCDADARETAPTVDEYDAGGGVLYLTWRTFAACPTGGEAPAPPPPSGDEDGGGDKGEREGDKGGDRDPVGHSAGLGFFGWFFTLLFVAALAYFGVGAYHNYTTYGATGWDMVPHRDVWRDLPFVVSDLFKGRGGSRSGYSALG
ncbi:autophagy-related protein 27 [Rhodotorula diobovata]|uniref:Autophagy-related protein 27 n=1 Tax=Rhodotorula diobovata TaxID=5288 RepID=A0A5C5FMZ4_9BASI|nr:autophagy-related protein 27 [Rhodotorula diobovata]